MTPADPSEAIPQRTKPWPVALLLAFLGLVLPLCLVGFVDSALAREHGLADLFFLGQDLPVAAAAALGLFVLRALPADRLAAWGAALRYVPSHPVAWSALAFLVGAAGWFLVFQAYPLSMDEFMAEFDAAIFRAGHAVAAVPQPWRDYNFPLQPQFMLRTADGSAWVSLYLPVNALFRAGFGLVGAAWASGPFWAAVAVIAVFAVARRLWPERPDAAVVSAVLLATSTQVLVTAMTPYAMSAHLAFNLVWLWLFLQPGWAAQVGAVAVAALACGLHQVVFHPLFAAPFVLGLWASRRWGRAAFYTAAYAVIGLFWILYWRLVLPGGGAEGAADAGVALLLRRLQGFLAAFGPQSIGYMAKNLLRFVSWQNPLTAALAVLGAGAAFRREPILRALLAGMGLTIIVVWLLMPSQGHGWGYRYLHGFLGGACLVAAYGWMKLTQPLDTGEQAVARASFALAALFSMLVLLPWRAAQAHAFSAPYAAASRAIARTPADVVLVDPGDLFFAADLVRNDPFLRNRPKVMDLGALDEAQLGRMCSTLKVSLFARREAEAFGIAPADGPPAPQLAAMRTSLARMGCGARLTPRP